MSIYDILLSDPTVPRQGGAVPPFEQDFGWPLPWLGVLYSMSPGFGTLIPEPVITVFS